MKYFYLLCVFQLFSIAALASDTLKLFHKIVILQPEFMIGQIYENYGDYPKHSKYIQSAILNLGTIDLDHEKKWTSFYNYPQIGISVAYTNLGNDSVLGKEFYLIPYAEFFPASNALNHISFKFGLGCSYFTKYHNPITNYSNQAIGSSFNWAFLAFMYYDIVRTRKFDLQLGAGYLHSSNGHTQLPNYGMNSGMVSLSGKFMLTGENARLLTPHRPLVNRTKHYFISIRNGYGIQEFGSAKGPAGSPKKPVYSFATSAGIVFRQCIKVDAGFTYRYYQQHYDYIVKNKTKDLFENPSFSASNVFFYLSCELLFGNISLDVEGGINIHKPFFENFYLHNGGPKTLNTKYYLKRIFPSRLGLKAYFFNTTKMPLNNYFISANINADFGQADFSEISFGYVKMIR